MAKSSEAVLDATEAPVEDAPPARRNRKTLVILIAGAVLALAAAGGALWYFLGDGGTEDDDEPPAAATKAGKAAKAGKPAKAGKAAKAAEKDKRPAVFMPLDTFTVNLQEEAGDHFLQIVIVLEASDDKALELIKAQMPVIRSRLLLLLSSKRPSELATLAGKERLADEIVAEARRHVAFKSPEQALNRAHFNSFVIQ